MSSPGAVDTQRRWLGIGRSDANDARTAGADATAAALSQSDAKLLTVFCSERYDLAELLAGINERSGGVPLIGCSTAGEIATDGPGEEGVVVVALGGDGFAVSTAVALEASSGLREAGAVVAGCSCADPRRPYRLLMLLTDGLAGDQQEIVRGAYSMLGAEVPLVGGCAGDDLKMKATSQLHGDRVLTDAVVAAAIASDAPFGIGVRHGWRTVGEPMLVTTSSANRVYRLDDSPALDVYLGRLGAPAEARTDAEAFTRFALTHPLGLSRRSGEEHVRFVADADFADRSLGCIAEVPQGTFAWFMEGDAASVLDATDAACTDALAPLGERRALGLIAFDCIARKGVLGGAGIATEVQQVAARAGGAPVAGFYTYGEIARTDGMSGFHNQTLVVLALS